MKRKVIKQGHNTLTITLPAKWVEQNGVKAGDEIEIWESGKNLLISKETKKELKRIDIDISGLDFASIRHKMRSAYKLGYDEIYLTFNNPITKEFKTGEERAVTQLINHEVNNLLGCEIIQQTKYSCLIKDYSFTSTEELDNILRKIFFMIIDYGDELLEEAKNMNKLLLETMWEKHFNISKFIFYYLRTLNRIGYKDSAKTPIIYYILSSLDDILDIEKYCASDLLKFKQKKLQNKTLQILQKVLDEFRTFHEYFYKPEVEKLLRFAEKRWEIVYEIRALAQTNIPRNELIIITNIEHILELLLHLFEARMSLDY